MDRRRFLARLGGTAIAAGLGTQALAACGGSSSAGGAGGVGGTLNTLAWNTYVNPTVTAAFRRAKGVTVKNASLATNEEIFARMKAGGVGKTDLMTPNIAYVEQLVAAGLLEPLDTSKLPNLAGLLPAMTRAMKTSGSVGGKAYAVPVAWGYDAMVYNATRMKRAPTSWKDLLRPELKGRVLLPDGPITTFEIWPRVLGYDMATLTKQQLDETTEFVIKLKKTQVRTISGDSEDMATLLARGDVWVTGAGTWFGLPGLVAQKGGDEARSIIPKEGAATWVDTYVMGKDAPNRDTAYAFLNDLLDPTRQVELVKVSASGTVSADAVQKVPKANRDLYGYKGDIGSGNAPLNVFPPLDKGYTTPTDWNDAWARIAAA
ncbi:spermidine/putrescine ABC transporter substrate-binding protein [Patulibacter sp. SYSU D01012]|uniref:ABC transporter substrate-binding protein n=1 Tax=Patulibacter sp. SYSU D01012 TaxID=2817381 RepID=UPI001B30764F|nr:spermidine/putrescine ABC transporter substrate-binding protein [Patulibacter sp. SYSU D01012]